MNTIINNVVVDRLVDPRKTLSTYGKDIVANGSGTITPKDKTKDSFSKDWSYWRSWESRECGTRGS